MAFELNSISQKLWSRKLADELAKDTVFSKFLLSDPLKPLNILERLRLRFYIFISRARDAYLVLVGKANIEDEDY